MFETVKKEVQHHMNVFELFGTIAINNDDANRKIDQTGKLANNLTSIFKKVGTAVATVFAIDKIKDFGQACAQTYATIAAENSAFAQIMGDYSDIAKEKMQKVADETGVVASRLTPYMTSMTAKFKGLGYGIDEATSLATEGLTIASDAAAFWDKSLDESMSHLNSFINGSYEGGEAIGLFANDTQMASYAVRQGVVKETKEWSKLDEAKKQALRMQYAKEMYKQSGATGQAAKESGEYANVLANLKEHWRQLQGIIGKPIMQKMVLPALQKLNKLMPSLTERVQGITEKATAGLEKIASYFTDVFTESGLDLSAVPRAFSQMFSDFTQNIPEWLSKAGTKLSKTWANSIWPSVREHLKVWFGIELPAWSEVESDIKTWWESSGTAYEKLKDIIKWTLGKFEAPDTSFIADVETWWNSTGKPTVTSVVQWTFGELVQPAWIDLVTKTTNWWNNDISPELSKLTTWFLNPEFPSWESIKEKATDWFDTLKRQLSAGWDALFNGGENHISSAYSPEATYEVDVVAGATILSEKIGDVLVPVEPYVAPGSEGELQNELDRTNLSVDVKVNPIMNWINGLFGSGSSINTTKTGVWYGAPFPTVTKNAEGAIFSQPTIFDTRLGYQMVGEAGPEAVAPIDKLQQYVSDAVKNTVGGMQFNVVLDTGVLVGQLAPRMDMQLGTLANRKGRG
jgi:hypothetical protein